MYITKDVSFKIVFGFFLILDILIRSNSLKRFRNILQTSKKSPYQRNDAINKNLQTQCCRTTILLYKIIFAAVGSTLFLTTDFDVMTRASFFDRVITMQLDSKYRRNLDF